MCFKLWRHILAFSDNYYGGNISKRPPSKLWTIKLDCNSFLDTFVKIRIVSMPVPLNTCEAGAHGTAQL